MTGTPTFVPFVDRYFRLLCGLFRLVITRIGRLGKTLRGADPARIAALFECPGLVVAGVGAVLRSIRPSLGLASGPLVQFWPAPRRWLTLGTSLLVVLGAAVWVFAGAGARRLAEAFGIGEARAKAVAALALMAVVPVNAPGTGLR